MQIGINSKNSPKIYGSFPIRQSKINHCLLLSITIFALILTYNEVLLDYQESASKLSAHYNIKIYVGKCDEWWTGWTTYRHWCRLYMPLYLKSHEKFMGNRHCRQATQIKYYLNIAFHHINKINTSIRNFSNVVV